MLCFLEERFDIVRRKLGFSVKGNKNVLVNIQRLLNLLKINS